MKTNWLYVVVAMCCICSSCGLLFDRDSHYPLIRAAERDADTQIEKQGYTCIGTGGSGTSDLRIISKEFACKNIKFLSVDEARMFLIEKAVKYLNTINSHKEIRPYFHNYPFNEKNISLGFSFYGEDGGLLAPPYIAHASVNCGHVSFRVGDIFKNYDKMKLYKESYQEALSIYKKQLNQQEQSKVIQ